MKMLANRDEDRKGSGSRIEGCNNGMITIECLRGRLLAERQASRSAKQDAELMGQKLVELENQLRKEIELRNGAERRLKFLIKKLESLNISSSSLKSVHSLSSESCEISAISSNSKETEEDDLKFRSTESKQNPSAQDSKFIGLKNTNSSVAENENENNQ